MVIKNRRAIMAAFMASIGVGTAVFALASPAQAAPGACYNKGSYSFQNDQSAWVIDVYNGSGCGTYMGFIIANPSSGGDIRLAAADRRCDNKGISLVVHGYVVASSGCGSDGDGVRYVSYSSIGSPKNMWALVAGTTNSNTINLPTPAS
jgi:hypothetical protein